MSLGLWWVKNLKLLTPRVMTSPGRYILVPSVVRTKVFAEQGLLTFPLYT